MTNPIDILDKHWASISTSDEEAMAEEWDNEVDLLGTEPGHPDFAAFAYRTCQCGQAIEGFYDYLSHLKSVLGEAIT